MKISLRNKTELPQKLQKRNREERQNNCMKRLQSSWHAMLIGVLMMLLCVVTRNLFIQMQKEQASRCFFVSKEPKNWEKACRQSLNMGLTWLWFWMLKTGHS